MGAVLPPRVQLAMSSYHHKWGGVYCWRLAGESPRCHVQTLSSAQDHPAVQNPPESPSVKWWQRRSRHSLCQRLNQIEIFSQNNLMLCLSVGIISGYFVMLAANVIHWLINSCKVVVFYYYNRFCIYYLKGFRTSFILSITFFKIMS